MNVQVTMKENVEQWLESLLQVTQETISDKVYEIDRDINKGSTVEEFTIAVSIHLVFTSFFYFFLIFYHDMELMFLYRDMELSVHFLIILYLFLMILRYF